MAIRNNFAGDPTSAGSRRDIAVGEARMGSVALAGAMSTALKGYRDGQEIFERLAKEDPTSNTDWRRDLPVSLQMSAMYCTRRAISATRSRAIAIALPSSSG